MKTERNLTIECATLLNILISRDESLFDIKPILRFLHSSEMCLLIKRRDFQALHIPTSRAFLR